MGNTMLPITVCIHLLEYRIKLCREFHAAFHATRTHSEARAQTQNWYQMHGDKKGGGAEAPPQSAALLLQGFAVKADGV